LKTFSQESDVTQQYIIIRNVAISGFEPVTYGSTDK